MKIFVGWWSFGNGRLYPVFMYQFKPEELFYYNMIRANDE